MSWVSPTGYSDPNNKWSNETNAYDGSTSTNASNAAADYNYYLWLTLASAISCTKIRVYVGAGPAGTLNVDWDVYYGGAWHNIHSGAISRLTWVEIEIGSTQLVDKMRTKHNDNTRSYLVYEAEFWQVGVAYYQTIEDSLGMVDSVVAPKAAFKIPVPVEKLGLTDVVTSKAAFRQAAIDKLGMAESVTPKWDAHVAVTDILGMVDSIPAPKSSLKIAVSEVLGMLDSVAKKAAFKQAVSEVLGMLDFAVRSRGFPVTISEILGLRDYLEAKKHVGRLGDLPDHYREGGA